jgi:transposase
MLATRLPENVLAAGHPLRRIKDMTRARLAPMAPLFRAMESSWGIAPDRGLLCLLLMALYDIRSEDLFCQQVSGNETFRWFLGMSQEDPALDPIVLAQMHTRLSRNRAAGEFFEQVIREATRAGLLADAGFSLDLRQMETWTRPRGASAAAATAAIR